MRPLKYYSKTVLATIPVKTLGSRIKDNYLVAKLACSNCYRHPDEFKDIGRNCWNYGEDVYNEDDDFEKEYQDFVKNYKSIMPNRK
jgi:hypothetical protein